MGHLASRDAYKNLEDRINWLTQGAPVSEQDIQLLENQKIEAAMR